MLLLSTKMSQLVYTPLEDIPTILSELRQGFLSGKLRPIAYRKYQILQLAYLLQDNSQRFQDALAADLGRPPLEAHTLDIAPSLSEIKNYYANVEKWSKPDRPPLSFNYTAMRPLVRKEGKGVVLIICPFNYPLFLSLGPIAAALAAGNAVVLKPSELTPAVSSLFSELFPKYLDPQLVRVVNGAIPETSKLLELQWDHILFTGSGAVGKIVASAAAKHLTPVTLELGGKSPVIIDPNCDLKTAARRILWGKFANAGQTCVAPDYILVPKGFQDTLVESLKETHARFYPEGDEGHFSRLVSPRAFSRVNKLLKDSKGTIVFGGETKEETKYIAPTVLKDVQPDDSLMSEELFGPVLPILTVENVDEAISFINAHDHPLAIYVFSQDPAFKAKVFNNTQSGAAVANETLFHCAVDGLPIGGIGPSGYGAHTGKYGFDTFTHFRATMDSPSWLDKLLSGRYPPYTAKKQKDMLRFLTPSLPTRPSGPPGAADAGLQIAQSKWFLLALVALPVTGLLTPWTKISGWTWPFGR
jgi:aldehyde dehydrogenase (NAD+)/aldehyde dehydrogenase (NAD(P)+)